MCGPSLAGAPGDAVVDERRRPREDDDDECGQRHGSLAGASLPARRVSGPSIAVLTRSRSRPSRRCPSTRAGAAGSRRPAERQEAADLADVRVPARDRLVRAGLDRAFRPVYGKARNCAPFSKRLKGLEPSTFCMATTPVALFYSVEERDLLAFLELRRVTMSHSG